MATLPWRGYPLASLLEFLPRSYWTSPVLSKKQATSPPPKMPRDSKGTFQGREQTVAILQPLGIFPGCTLAFPAFHGSSSWFLGVCPQLQPAFNPEDYTWQSPSTVFITCTGGPEHRLQDYALRPCRNDILWLLDCNCWCHNPQSNFNSSMATRGFCLHSSVSGWELLVCSLLYNWYLPYEHCVRPSLYSAAGSSDYIIRFLK